jgi:hypothetical protein
VSAAGAFGAAVVTFSGGGVVACLTEFALTGPQASLIGMRCWVPICGAAPWLAATAVALALLRRAGLFTAQIHKNIRHVIDAQKIRHVIDAAFSKNAFWAYILAKNRAYI